MASHFLSEGSDTNTSAIFFIASLISRMCEIGCHVWQPRDDALQLGAHVEL